MQIITTLNGRNVRYTGIGGDQGTGNQQYANTIRSQFLKSQPVLSFWARREGDYRRRLHNIYIEDGITDVQVYPDNYFIG